MALEKLGPYKIGRLLGRGGMGAVYVGQKEETGERAAIKVLSGYLADDAGFRERFTQEIETLKRLLHPNIVQLFGFGEEDGNLYYVMEFVDGSSLHDELAAGRRFNWREVARLGIAIAMALKHAHDRGIIHRDLKPGNLLLDKEENVKLADFGIAKLYGGANVTAAGGVLGTADYMAPEQGEGKAVTSRCDLYSLGSVLYALLTGKPPFGGRTIYDVMAALKNERPVPVRRLAPETPEEFEQIILQLLEKDPQDRIPTARALANRLRAMEHALSLETRVFFPGQEPDELPTMAKEESTATAKTAPMESMPSPTHAFSTAADDEYRLLNGLPQVRTSISDNASGRTELRRQEPEAVAEETVEREESLESVSPAKTFVAVSEEELRGGQDSDDTWTRQWTVVAGMLVLFAAILGGIAFLATRPPSADRLYAAVKQAAEVGPEQVATVETELARFLAAFPDDARAAEMRGYGEELERFRLQKRFEQRLRRADNLESLSPIERAYSEAVQVAAADPGSALTKFEALLAVFDGHLDPGQIASEQRPTTQCLELARKQVERLRPVVAKINAEQLAVLRSQLQRADSLAVADRPGAEKIWRGIEVLYQDKSWAQELVEEARRKLAGAAEKSPQGKD